MTEPSRPRRPRRPGCSPSAAGRSAAFVVVLALLVLQLRAGRDPALGARPRGRGRRRRRAACSCAA